MTRRLSLAQRQMPLLSFTLFFFSSRRRHTRYIGDWSSDVCSSDLVISLEQAPDKAAVHSDRGARDVAGALGSEKSHDRDPEERRVGKECRSQWSPNHE